MKIEECTFGDLKEGERFIIECTKVGNLVYCIKETKVRSFAYNTMPVGRILPESEDTK